MNLSPRMTETVIALGSMAVLAAAANFAFAPTVAPPLLPSTVFTPSGENDAHSSPALDERPPLDLVGFERAKLVATPPKPVAKDAVTASFQFGALTLVAILDTSEGKKAGIYGESSDTFVLVKPGDRVGDLRVVSIDATSVEVEQGDQRNRLTLVDGPRASRGAR